MVIIILCGIYYLCTNSYVMSKRYFEKTAKDVLGDYVDGDGLILSNWWK